SPAVSPTGEPRVPVLASMAARSPRRCSGCIQPPLLEFRRRCRMSVAPAEAPERTENEYAHLAELFVERAGLAADDPRRAVLRAELITGYLPVARNIAHRFLHRGDSIDDLE